jgi:lipopolysaccharide/colanic/teichoic acid biosynthesis glycosyltransferase
MSVTSQFFPATHQSIRIEGVSYRVGKRAFDVVVSGMFLIVASPVMLLIALLVLIRDGRPVFYAQDRIGQNDRRFRMWKFRTMRPNARHLISHTTDNDQRCTALGRYLRYLSLDELPQLWNVIRGDMSLVGPRPEMVHFVRKFSSEFPRYRARHTGRVGVTGLAQVRGLRGNTPINERVSVDLWYLENWSPWLDATILLLTFAVVISAIAQLPKQL